MEPTMTLNTEYGPLTLSFYHFKEEDRYGNVTVERGVTADNNCNRDTDAPLVINRIEVELRVSLTEDNNPSGYKKGDYGNRRRWGSWQNNNLPDGVSKKVTALYPLIWQAYKDNQHLQLEAEKGWFKRAIEQQLVKQNEALKAAQDAENKMRELEQQLRELEATYS